MHNSLFSNTLPYKLRYRGGQEGDIRQKKSEGGKEMRLKKNV